MTKTQCYIVDIDGTVADLSHRRHHVESSPKNWPAFHAGASNDAPIGHMHEIVLQLEKVRPIVYVSGRHEALRSVTEYWLLLHGIWYGSMYMRADGDFRDDSVVKKELLDRLRTDGWEPAVAFDDRDRVVKMWRENGVPCFQVAPGDF
jgi:hypothetical protein